MNKLTEREEVVLSAIVDGYGTPGEVEAKTGVESGKVHPIAEKFSSLISIHTTPCGVVYNTKALAKLQLAKYKLKTGEQKDASCSRK